MKLINVDISLESVGRVKNALDPVDPQDLVTMAHLDATVGAISSGNSFSYKLIQATETVVIPVNREMLVNNYIDVDGILNIEGDLSIV